MIVEDMNQSEQGYRATGASATIHVNTCLHTWIQYSILPRDRDEWTSSLHSGPKVFYSIQVGLSERTQREMGCEQEL